MDGLIKNTIYQARTIAPRSEEVNCNNVQETCTIRTSGNSSNTPLSGHNGMLITFAPIPGTAMVQLFWSDNDVWYRRKYWYTGWGNWVTCNW